MQHERFLLTAILAIAGVSLSGCDRLPGRGRVHVSYVVTVADDASRGASVEVRAHGTIPGGFRLLLPPQGRRRELRPFAPDAGGAKTDDPVVRYRVPAPGAPHGGHGFACYRGFELLAQPAGVVPGRIDSVFLEFHLPEDHVVVAPLVVLALDPDRPRSGRIALTQEEFEGLLESYIAIGDYSLRVLPAVEGLLPPIVWGRRGLGRASEGELIDIVGRLLRAHAARFGPDRPGVPYSVVVDYPYAGHGFAGNATGRSIDLRLSRDHGVLESPGLVRLAAHELAHFWLGGAFPFPKPEDHWFVEGAADYYGLCARVRAGLTDEPLAGDELAAQWFDLLGNPWLGRPMEDLGRSFTLEPEAFTASYARGCLTTWALDWRCRTAGRPPVEKLLQERVRTREHPTMRILLSEHLRGESTGPNNPAADVGPLLGADPQPTFTRILADAGFTHHTVATRDLTFGLERFEPGTTRLVAVPAGSPARSAGVRPGDAIRQVDGLPVFDTMQLQQAMERSYARPAYKLEGMEVTYERSGTFESVRLFAAPQVESHWLDASGERAAFVLPGGGR